MSCPKGIKNVKRKKINEHFRRKNICWIFCVNFHMGTIFWACKNNNFYAKLITKLQNYLPNNQKEIIFGGNCCSIKISKKWKPRVFSWIKSLWVGIHVWIKRMLLLMSLINSRTLSIFDFFTWHLNVILYIKKILQ